MNSTNNTTTTTDSDQYNGIVNLIKKLSKFQINEKVWKKKT